MLWLFSLLLGLSAGLRSMTPLAVVAWAARGWPMLSASPLSFMATPVVRLVLTLLAAGELIADKLPFIPSRLQPAPLIGRLCSGGLCGALLCIAGGESVIVGTIAGAIGGVAGAFAGYHARRSLTVSRGFPDLHVALVEDVIAIGLAVLAVSRV